MLPKHMRQWTLSPRPGFESLTLGEAPVPAPAAGEVLVRVRAASLNYRDLVIAENAVTNGGSRGRAPLSDGVGEIVAVGEGVPNERVGQRVMGSFFQRWNDGPFEVRYHEHALGGSASGMAAEYVLLRAETAVPVPSSVSDTAAASLPCAGVTAWNALFESASTKAGDIVVVQGTGGVSMFGLQLARIAGAQVVVTSSSDAKLDKARGLGATHVVNYKQTPSWSAKVNELTGGAHHVLEVGGANTFEEAAKSLRAEGVLSVIGILSGLTANIGIYPIIHSALRVHGIYVGSAAMLSRLVDVIAQHRVEPVIDRTFAFDELPAAYAHQKSGAHFGKVVVTI